MEAIRGGGRGVSSMRCDFRGSSAFFTSTTAHIHAHPLDVVTPTMPRGVARGSRKASSVVLCAMLDASCREYLVSETGSLPQIWRRFGGDLEPGCATPDTPCSQRGAGISASIIGRWTLRPGKDGTKNRDGDRLRGRLLSAFQPLRSLKRGRIAALSAPMFLPLRFGEAPKLILPIAECIALLA